MNKKKTFLVSVTGVCNETLEVEATSEKQAISHVKKHGFMGKNVTGFGTTQWEDINEVEGQGEKEKGGSE